MMPPLPESFTILSRRKSGTEEVVSRASAIEYGAACAAAERERCIAIIEAHQVSVGNSPAGEMAADWTMDALREVRAAIRAQD